MANLVIFAVALGIAGRLVKQRWDGVFIDRECRISLSRFQLILWTLLLVSALMTVGLTNTMAEGTIPAPPTGMKVPEGPLDIYIPPEIWALLGLGALTAVSAPGIKASRRIARNNPAVAPFDEQRAIDTVQASQGLVVAPFYEGDVLVKASPEDARWRDLITGDYQGAPFVDVSKLQQLAFTILTVVVYAAGIWELLDVPLPTDGKVVPILFFPVASWGLVSLLGISHAAYLTDKQFGDT